MQIKNYSAFKYYGERIARNQRALSSVRKKNYLTGTIRLITFLGTGIAAWLFRAFGTGAVVGIWFAGAVLFLVWLYQYHRLQKRKEYLETSICCDKNELKGLAYDFSAFDGASEQVDAGHFFSLDLDIFGNHSLFQSINRTCTNQGRNRLINWFLTPLQDAEAIQIRQEAIRELSAKPDFMRHFQVLGQINPGKHSDYREIEDFVQHSSCIPSVKYWKIAAFLFPVIWIAGFVLLALSVLPVTCLSGIYLLAILISESKIKTINRLQQMTGKKVNILHAYVELIQAVENENWQASSLQELHAVFVQGNRKASSDFRRLVRLAGELEQRSNLLIHILFNPLLLWDIKKSIQLEEWKRRYGSNLLHWISTLGEWDAYCSLGAFAFNHPDYLYPAFSDSYFEMRGTGLEHPLMKRETCVRNPVSIENHPFFLIVTGANMAGKSTYLRTVGVTFILACIGVPVCAESLTLYPAKLITSLRTSDSLNDNESYFFAELKRLKMIIDALHAGEKLFIILDEILKGTNSVDKQKGSRALISQFIHLQSCGIIATHDLILGDLATEFPDNIRNYRFEADIQNQELSFSYQLREGIAQNMNACFLMHKMGITMR